VCMCEGVSTCELSAQFFFEPKTSLKIKKFYIHICIYTHLHVSTHMYIYFFVLFFWDRI
jgi:hypothetical protein